MASATPMPAQPGRIAVEPTRPDGRWIGPGSPSPAPSTSEASMPAWSSSSRTSRAPVSKPSSAP